MTNPLRHKLDYPTYVARVCEELCVECGGMLSYPDCVRPSDGEWDGYGEPCALCLAVEELEKYALDGLDIAAKAFRAETVLSLLWSEGVCLFEGEDWDWEGAAWAALQEACREWDAWKGEGP